MGQNQIFKLKADLLISIFSLAISTFAGYWAYPQVLRYERDSRQTLFTIEEKSGSLSLLNAQGCVAQLQSKLNFDQVFSLRIQGTLRLSIDGKPINSLLDYQARFNPLGQLNQSAFTLSSKEFMLRFLTEGVNPIQISMFGQGNSAATGKKISLPGPLTISKLYNKEGSSRYALYYQGLPKGLGMSAAQFVPTLLQGAQMPKLRLAHDSSVCQSKPEARISLDALISLSKALRQGSDKLQLKGP